jgi:anaerobic magnesium-protoporphyrin IX monomethyl ester cyclase
LRVLLVQAYLGRFEEGGNVFPLGLCYIATALKGHDVRIFDPNTSKVPYDELKAQLITFVPDVIGISLRNIDTTQIRDLFYYFKTIRPTINVIKEINPLIRIVIGGSGFSMFARKIMERFPEIDFGVYLEGDESMPELLSNLNRPDDVKGIFIRKGTSVVFTGQRPFPNLARLSIPRRDLVDIRKYDHPIYTTIGVQTKRGCPLCCAYCSYPFLNGREVRTRSAELIADEIEDLVNNYNIKRFMFTDSIFNIPEQHAENICQEIIRRGLNVEWSAWYNVKGLSEEMVKLAVDAGCTNFSFSPDAASDPSLKALGKNFTEEDLIRVIKLLRKTVGVRVEFNFFCTPPKQNFIGFLKVLRLFLTINFLFRGRAVVNLSWIRIEPETSICGVAIKDGIIDSKTELLPDEERDLAGLFYSCPATAWYADPVFNFILNLQEIAKPFLKKLLHRGKESRSRQIKTDLKR